MRWIAVCLAFLFPSPAFAQTCVPMGAPRAMSADLVNGYIELTFFWQDNCRAVIRALGTQFEYIEAPAPYAIGSAPWATMLDIEWHEPWPSGVSNNYWFVEENGDISFGCPAIPCTYFGNPVTEAWNVLPVGEVRFNMADAISFAQWDDGDGPWFEFLMRDGRFVHFDRSDSNRVGAHEFQSARLTALAAVGVTDLVSHGKLNGHNGGEYLVTPGGDVWFVDGSLTPTLVGNTFQWWPQDTGVQRRGHTWGELKVIYR